MASVVEIASTALGVIQAGPDGRLLAHEPVSITNLDASPATHYATVTKTDPQTGPLSSDANGVVPRYIETGTYLQTVRGTTRQLQAVSGADARSVESSIATRVITGVGAPSSLEAGQTYFELDGSGNVVAEWAGVA